MLAALFEPDPTTMSFGRALARSGCDSTFALAAAGQTVDFKRRSNKRSTPSLRNETVGLWMRQRLDDKTATGVKDVKRKAMKEFGLTEYVVNDIWLEWHDWERLRAALPAFDPKLHSKRGAKP
jgi:hypothetical protein